MKTALAISHVPFEDLGTLEAALEEAGFAIEQCAATDATLAAFGALEHDLLIVLGGPIGVYDAAIYPCIDVELALLRERLAAARPTLGICLGAQLMAAALGARVFAGGNGKELGWHPVLPGLDAAGFAGLEALFAPGLEVLHWHGDTFELPAGARHLASTAAYPNQAFALGQHALGLQFHPEVTADGLERWYVGHACELAAAGADVAALREQGRRLAPALEQAARRFWRAWLQAACP
ncbi:MAG: glutamine amidotransferase [Candidatus Dactylopiibacterium sp.]|nr:glutamine amidotransferase [Candidatus Dactylopiibacterium sp.]